MLVGASSPDAEQQSMNMMGAMWEANVPSQLSVALAYNEGECEQTEGYISGHVYG